MSERPHRCRTWAPRGQTPQLQFHFNWKQLSVIAGITWWQFYFRLYPGAIKAPQVVEFLGHLTRQIPGPCWSSGTDFPSIEVAAYATSWRPVLAV